LEKPKHDPEIRRIWKEASNRYRIKKKTKQAEGLTAKETAC
jgi:hypothetical protein